ncbi:MAG: cupin domain-containing protein [Bacilli bacterium]|jgi:mannose-6-phosphate isomerase-like protein (cupin superfamily)
MKIDEYKKSALLIRETEVYNVYDYKQLQNLSLSLTELHPDQKTSGHYHDDADEVYIFISGQGKLQIAKEFVTCEKGDVFVIPRGAFHKVWNETQEDLKFWSVFEKYGNRT